MKLRFDISVTFYCIILVKTVTGVLISTFFRECRNSRNQLFLGFFLFLLWHLLKALWFRALHEEWALAGGIADGLWPKLAYVSWIFSGTAHCPAAYHCLPLHTTLAPTAYILAGFSIALHSCFLHTTQPPTTKSYVGAIYSVTAQVLTSVSRFATSCSSWKDALGFVIFWQFWTIGYLS